MKSRVFLVLALIALMAAAAFAQTEADFLVTVANNQATILAYKGSATTVNIPARIQNAPVTVIGGQAFGPNSPNSGNITSIIVPEGVTTIQQWAFANSGITSITLPNSLRTIEQQVFQNCNKLTSITIPAGVTSLGGAVFMGCTSLTSITFAGTLAASGFNAQAFLQLGDLRDKYLAASGGIGTYTRQASGTVWTKSASSASAPAAAGTPGLAFALTGDGKGYSVSRGTASGDVVIPSSYNNLPVTEIANTAFNGVSAVNSVIIPDSVTSVGQMAFQQCINLSRITLGSGVKLIGINAFNGCGSLTSVTFRSAISLEPTVGFTGDLSAKHRAGGPGTYTRNGQVWTKQ
jgi:hypothetical protein